MTAARRAMLLVTILLAAMGSSGCLVASLSPLYEPEGIEFDAALCGTWANDEDRQSLDLARGEWRSYDLTWQDGPQSVRATAHLVPLGGARYLDVTAVTGQDRGPLIVPVHVFARVRIEGDTLSIDLLNFARLASPAGRGLLPQGRFALDERDNIVLTGSTRALRTWLSGRQGNPDLFTAPVVLARRPPAGPPPSAPPDGSAEPSSH